MDRVADLAVLRFMKLKQAINKMRTAIIERMLMNAKLPPDPSKEKWEWRYITTG